MEAETPTWFQVLALGIGLTLFVAAILGWLRDNPHSVSSEEA